MSHLSRLGSIFSTQVPFPQKCLSLCQINKHRTSTAPQAVVPTSHLLFSREGWLRPATGHQPMERDRRLLCSNLKTSALSLLASFPDLASYSVPWLLHGAAESQDLDLTVSAETSRDFPLSTAAMGLAVPTSQSTHGSPNAQLPECKCPQDLCIYNSIKIRPPCWGRAQRMQHEDGSL